MEPDFDLVVRGGLVVDGSGGEPFAADVAIRDGMIAAVGPVPGTGAEEIDARGLLVTPGFVDLHTHYDGQVTWDNRLAPSSSHGITTAIIGNCGVGFAPCKPDQRELLIELMEGVEDIPHPVLTAGLPWTWQSFPEYLDLLASRRFDMDIGAYLPHAPVRVFVMGQRALDLEPATAQDIQHMANIAREAIRAGALGLATSRTLFHRSSNGASIPTLRATEEELRGLAGALSDADGGILQFVGDNQADVLEILIRLTRETGLRATFTMGTSNRPPFQWPQILERVQQANDEGLNIHPQVLPRAIGMILCHELTLNPFYATDTYRTLAALPLDQRLAELRKPEVREAILSESNRPDPNNPLGASVRQFEFMFQLADRPDYEQPPEASIASRAARMGTSAEALAYDLLLENGGRGMLYLAMGNFPQGKLDDVRAIMRHRDVVPGLGDGGAHCGTICDASYSTFLLIDYARKRGNTDGLTLPQAINKLTRAPAEIIGLRDRGLVAAGHKADLNVIDFDRLAMHAPEIAHDLPSGGRRLVQRADGYVATIVSGEVVSRNGLPTGALPGRLVRGERAAV